MLRFSDVLRFSVTALLQQKTRSLLTVLGVLFATFVLVISLSLRIGTEQALLGMFRRHNELRMVRVYPGSAPRESSTAESNLEVTGDMGAARKARLGEALLRQWHTKNRQVTLPLTRERFQKLAALNHVESVVPVYYGVGRAIVRENGVDARAYALPTEAPLAPFIVAGRPLGAGDDRVVLVNEFLLYRLGVRDDVDLQAVLGQPLRLQYRVGPRKPNLLLALLNGSAGGELAPAEEQALEKTVAELPKALAALNLGATEKAALKKLLTAPRTRTDEAPVSEDLTIAGVFRIASRDDPRSAVASLTEQADLLIPLKTGEQLFFRMPDVRESGLGEATVMVDSEQNVQSVLEEIRGLGLNGFAALEHVERDRYLFALLMSVMTCVAAVAILVAAFGITNTMLMSVLERQREIGIMKAVGARERDIQTIFLVEGAGIGAVGSGLGLLLGFAASFPGDAWLRSMIAGQTPLPVTDPLFIFPLWLALAVPPIVVLVTILAAALPARRAVRLDPVVALRHE